MADSPTKELDVKKLLVPQLRKELSNRGLETTGRKAELVTRLEKAMSSDSIVPEANAMAGPPGGVVPPAGAGTPSPASPPPSTSAVINAPPSSGTRNRLKVRNEAKYNSPEHAHDHAHGSGHGNGANLLPPISSSSSSSPPSAVAQPKPGQQASLYAIAVGLFAVVAFVFNHRVQNEALRTQILVNFGLSMLGFVLSLRFTHVMKAYTLRAGLSGKDLNKPGPRELKPDVPEALGLVTGVTFVVVIIGCQLLMKMGYLHSSFDKDRLVEYNAALQSIGFMFFLGFADDALDLPWRYKLILPSISTLPLLVSYSGSTYVALPKFLAALGAPTALNLGIFYYVYMGSLAVFCTNAINIYAGINGLEAGQSFIIGVAVLIHNLCELSGPVGSNHLFSMFLIVPFIFVVLGLLHHNWYPSQVFVGDTFTYFAGMTFAVVGIFGHFSKTLLLFFIPQVINFLYSVPQLFGWVPCPRHRLPMLNTATGLLEGVPTHMNLVNLWIRIWGPMREDRLCLSLLGFQVVCCALAFFIRYTVADWLYNHFTLPL